MRIFLPDPGIEKTWGHNFAHACSIAEECRRRSIEIDILAHVDITREAVQRLPCRPIFRTSIFDHGPKPEKVPAWFSLVVYLVQVQRFFKDLSAALTNQVRASDVILLNTVKPSFLAGYARWLSTLPPTERPCSAIVLRSAPDDGLGKRRLPGISRALNKRLLHRIRNLSGGQLLLGVDTILVGQDFANLLELEISQIPLPLSLPAAKQQKMESSNIHLVYLGKPRGERGFHLLADALSLAMERSPYLSATIQIPMSGGIVKKRQARSVRRLRRLGPRVKLIEGELSEDRFYDCLMDSDAVLLPYDPGKYAKRSSQVLIEAASLARPVIVTRGTFLEHEMKELGIAGVVCQRFDSDALAEAIVFFEENRQALLDKAWVRCETIRKLHNAAAFVDCLEALSTGKSVALTDPGAASPQPVAL